MSHSIFNKSEKNDKKDQIIKMSQNLGFDVIGFADPKLPKNVKHNLDIFLKILLHTFQVIY